MKKLIVFSLFLLFSSCFTRFKPNHAEYLIDEKTILVLKDDIPSKYFLLRSTSDTTFYTEITENDKYVILNDSLFYFKKIGDTLHFDYIAKSRFWRIRN